MKQTEERNVYYLTLHNEETHYVSLTDSQVNLVNWLRHEGCDIKLEKVENKTPIVI